MDVLKGALFALGLVALLAVPAQGAVILFDHAVDSEVTDNGDGTWTYAFTVEAVEGGDIYAWAMPYFDDAGISRIQAPDGWLAEIVDIGSSGMGDFWDGYAAWQDPMDPNYQGAASPFTTGTQAIVWSVFYDEVPVGLGEELGGFAFTAAYGPTKYPHQVLFGTNPNNHDTIQSGDPQGPGSPTVLGNSGPPAPEPSSVLLLAAGGAALLLWRKRA